MNKEKAQRLRLAAEERSRKAAARRAGTKIDEEKKTKTIREVLANGKNRELTMLQRQFHFPEQEHALIRETLFTPVFRRTEKLRDSRFGPMFSVLIATQNKWLAPIKDWRPKGKSPDSQARSLLRHLLVKYEVPAFMYKALLSIPALRGQLPAGAFTAHPDVRLFLFLAEGGSLYKAANRVPGVNYGTEFRLPVPLTRRMCFEFLQTTSEFTPMQAIRRAQATCLGGDHRTVNALGTHPWDLGDPAWEEMQSQLIQWICQQPMLNPAQFGPIRDWVRNRWNADHSFSMKGRTGTSVLRDVEEWHAILQASRINHKKNETFEPSAFIAPATYERNITVNKTDHVERWTFTEVTSVKGLIEEGKKLAHCVYSYANSCAEGACSIWSMRVDDERRLTLEVRPNAGAIVQIRGFANRAATSGELAMIRRWARENGLDVSSRF